MASIVDDLRHGLRGLKQSPGFALTAVLTLALGIGATTAIFTLVYDVLLRPLPFPDAERMVVVREVIAEFRDVYPTLPVNANNFTMWQQNSRSFETLAVMSQSANPLGTGEHPVQAQILSSTPGLFRIFNLTPALGRFFTQAEAQRGHDRVVVLMYETWNDLFQGDPGIVGRKVTLNGFSYTVIGVMPKDTRLPLRQGLSSLEATKPPAAIVPKSFSNDQLQEAVGDFNYFCLGLMKPGVSLAQASEEINALQRQITAGLSGDSRATLSAVVQPYQRVLVGDNSRPMLILLAGVAGLLLVGCINITNLLLARATSRRQQMAVASALGARPSTLMRLALRETVTLAAIGAAFGVALAMILLPVMQRFLPLTLDFRGPIRLDWVGALCATVLAIAAALVAGTAPAWLASRTDPAEVLHSESRLATESRSSKRLRRVLVAGEVAVSIALVLLTGLLTLSLGRMLRVDRGFETTHTITAKVTLPSGSYREQTQRAEFYRRARERLRQLPGAQQAGFVSHLPLDDDGWGDSIRTQGDTRPVMQLQGQHFRWMTPGYMEAIHLQLTSGRLLNDSDQDKPLAVISELTAKTIWPNQNPVGQTFTRGGNPNLSFTVIGVVKDAHVVSLAAPDPMIVYVPTWFRAETSAGLVLRTNQNPAQMADAVRRALWSVDPSVAIPEVRSMDGIVADSVATRRFEMDLLLLFAASALLLAGLGIYGVVTYSVVQREREIGLRIALGARRENIYRMVLREGLLPVLAGVVAGTGIAFALARLAKSLLFEVSPYNPAIVCLSIGVLIAAGLVACLLPARRAASVEPMVALRSE